MSDLISRSALTAKGEKMRLINPTRAEERIVALYRKEKGYAADIFNTAVDAAQTIILDMYDNEAIEAEPVKKGRWIERHLCNGDTVYQCDQKKCYKVQIHMSPYGPNCGAKMDKEDEGNDEN